MTSKDIERLALSTMAPYIVNREEKIFLMDAPTLEKFVALVNEEHKRELTE